MPDKYTYAVEVAERPYTLTFEATGRGESYRSSYPLTSHEAERLIAEYPITSASPNRVVLRPDQPGLQSVIRPATLGGGNAFTVRTVGRIA